MTMHQRRIFAHQWLFPDSAAYLYNCQYTNVVGDLAVVLIRIVEEMMQTRKRRISVEIRHILCGMEIVFPHGFPEGMRKHCTLLTSLPPPSFGNTERLQAITVGLIPFRNLTSNIEIIGRNYQLLSSEAAETVPDIHS